jgi:hypothetical protein
MSKFTGRRAQAKGSDCLNVRGCHHLLRMFCNNFKILHCNSRMMQGMNFLFKLVDLKFYIPNRIIFLDNSFASRPKNGGMGQDIYLTCCGPIKIHFSF